MYTQVPRTQKAPGSQERRDHDDGEAAALTLWRETGVRVLPGAYLGRETEAGNPGQGYIRVALVAPKDDVNRGLTALRDCLYQRGK